MKSLLKTLSLLALSEVHAFQAVDPAIDSDGKGFNILMEYDHTSAYSTLLFIGTPYQEFKKMRFSMDYSAIIVGAKSCKDCKYTKHYDPKKSKSDKVVSKEIQVKSLNNGNYNVALYKDKLCIANKDFCLNNFIFETQKTGTGISEHVGGIIGLGPGG
jgi:hypothetical protein